NNADGKKIIMNLYKMEKKYPGSVVFVQNYGMDIGRMLTRGCDVWLNNPIRPKEASGTSGMKAAMNGVLNFSILDGWWPEMCNHGINGWQIGDGYEGPDCNAIDSSSLYEVLRNEIIPTYYNNRAKWIEMMYQSIHDAHYEFSAERMVRAYAEMMYD
ncbi:MAG: alpha-glucan family phosphorylase, partial [Clostridiales bacterium]|nr:alpha-glucan family phosphorylase [Clostridiales bacterium]